MVNQFYNPIILSILFYSIFYKEQLRLFLNADSHLQERARQDVPAYLGLVSHMIMYNRYHHISKRVRCTFYKEDSLFRRTIHNRTTFENQVHADSKIDAFFHKTLVMLSMKSPSSLYNHNTNKPLYFYFPRNQCSKISILII
jgi:hypothetical protein